MTDIESLLNKQDFLKEVYSESKNGAIFPFNIRHPVNPSFPSRLFDTCNRNYLFGHDDLYWAPFNPTTLIFFEMR